MITSETTYRVRYADTDQLGVVYYGNYARFYEIGRTEMIRDVGLTYKDIESSGVGMPVVSVQARYRHFALYDELITIRTRVEKMPEARIIFHHEILNEKGTVIHTAEVTLAFFDLETSRPTRAPKILTDVMEREWK